MAGAVDEIFELYAAKGSGAYFGERVTQLQHALQTANLARKAHASEEVILAALLHDIGHLLGGEQHDEIGVIDHDTSAIEWLRSRRFSEHLIRLVSSHVSAKRYLTATNPSYRDRLSEASRKTLQLQGGPMSQEEAIAFARSPWLDEILRVRSWDEQAKDPDAEVPGLETYRGMLAAHLASAR